MSHSLLLRGARQLLTLRGKPGVRRGPDFGNLEIIEDGSVFIKDGKIACVGQTRRLENLKEVSAAIEIPVHNCVVMPGFIDSSIQLSLAVATDGRPKRKKLRDIYDESVTLMRSCLQHGTLNARVRACSGIQSFNADLSLLRQIARIGNTPIGLKPIWSPDPEWIDVCAPKALYRAFETVVKRGLADSIEVRGNSNDSARDSLLRLALQAEMQLNLSWLGGDANRLADALKETAPAGISCGHNVSPAELQVLADAKSTVIFDAGSALLDSQPTRCTRDLINLGGALALGSGYHAQYEPNFNMQLVLAIAVRRLGLTIEQAIVATTINAAYAMNCGDQIGSLEPGKRAEVLVLNLSDYREIPRRMGVNHVAMVIRDGNIAINRTRWRVGTA